MNKKNMVCSAFLMFLVATTALPICEQERDIVYAMHTLGQDLTDVPMVKQNVDMFISAFQLNSQLLEKKLAVADQKAKKALLTNGALILGATFATIATKRTMAYVFNRAWDYSSKQRALSVLIEKASFGFLGATKLYAGISVFDVFKEKNALKEALELDQEILEQLLTIKDLAMFSLDTDVAEESMDAQDAALEVVELE